MNFFSESFDKLHFNMKSLYDLLRDNKKFRWNKEIETLFQQRKSFLKENVIPTLHNTNHPFFITVDFSLFGIDCVLFQIIDEGELDFFAIPDFFTTIEQKLCTTYPELIRIFYSPIYIRPF